MNVGASAPEESGLYFSWGNSPGHTEGSGYDFSEEVYNETPGAAIEANLTLAEDMARQSLGTPWRMPTKDEFKELYDNCTNVWATINGVAGCLFTSKINGNTVFFPAAGLYDRTEIADAGVIGDYWSSTFYTSSSVFILSTSSEEVLDSETCERFFGFPIRAVQD